MSIPKGGAQAARIKTVATRVAAAMSLSLCAQPAIPQEAFWSRPTLNFMGVPGLLDMPTAHQMHDADLSLTVGNLGETTRATMRFQIAPRVAGVFRYARIDGYRGPNDYYDRSFDVAFLLAEESAHMPAVTLGLQDFGGTGVYGGEYLVATKTFGRLRATAGIGWGRFGSYNGFSNPLGSLSSSFKTRDDSLRGYEDAGNVDFGNWFRGDAAFFGGLQYAVNDRLLLSAEYSSDGYDTEANSEWMDFEHNSPINVGLTYRIRDNLDLTGAYLYGSTLAVQLNYTFNPKTPNRYPGGLDRAPRPVAVRAPGSAADLGWTGIAGAQTILRNDMQLLLAGDDMVLERFSVDARTARIGVRTGLQAYPAQALGRIGRLMSQRMPPSVERFEITLVSGNGMPVSTVVLNRSDLEELEHAPDGAWQSFARARISDATPSPDGIPENAFPKFSWSFGPFLSAAYFDPEEPLRLSLGAQVTGRFEPTPGLVLEGVVQKQLVENVSDLPKSSSALPRVRTDNGRYAEEGDLALTSLTATKYFRPDEDLFARVTAGYFEPMYGGLSGELLWKPVDSRLGVGVEMNYAKKREFSQGFGFQDYDIVTGHASVYYEARNDFLYQVDAGRYLAGDWGATFGVDREFDNGIRIGAFATFTDVSFDDFGEGSFDKGIRIRIPVSALTGTRTNATVARTIRPVLRDGGARLKIDSRLYEQVRSYQQPELQGQWGRFWR